MFLHHFQQMLILNTYRTERFQRMNKTINTLFIFDLKSAENAIPDYKHAAVVLVNHPRIARVMHAMMTRSHKQKLNQFLIPKTNL
jgi:predicted phosphoadenosine phosphosulfate sulfurtransferase